MKSISVTTFLKTSESEDSSKSSHLNNFPIMNAFVYYYVFIFKGPSVLIYRAHLNDIRHMIFAAFFMIGSRIFIYVKVVHSISINHIILISEFLMHYSWIHHNRFIQSFRIKVFSATIQLRRWKIWTFFCDFADLRSDRLNHLKRPTSDSRG